MAYHILTISFLIIAALLILFALRTLFHRNWLFGWIRGTAGIVLLCLAASAAIVALDLSSYRQLDKEQPIASLSFYEDGTQHYRVTVVEPNGREQEFALSGDLWQIDARIIKWSKPLASLGIKPGYRLWRLSGRYYSLEQERSADRTVYDLNNKEYGIDLWQWLRNNPRVPWVDTVYGNAAFLPMTDGALFTVNMTANGLIARPLNEPAEKSVSQWQ